MRRAFRRAAVALTLSIAAVPAHAAPGGLADAERAWGARCDGRAVGGLLDEAFQWIDARGRVQAGPALPSPPCQAEGDVSLREYGTLGVVAGSQPAAGRFLRVWVQRKSGWRLLLLQDTAVWTPAPPPAPPLPEPAAALLPKGEGVAELATTLAAMEAAIVAKDVEAYTPLVADEFLLVGQRFSGKAATKADRIAALREPKPPAAASKPARVTAMSVQRFGAAAVMSTEQVGGDGTPSRATRIWVERDGRWQLAFSQQTPVLP